MQFRDWQNFPILRTCCNPESLWLGEIEPQFRYSETFTPSYGLFFVILYCLRQHSEMVTFRHSPFPEPITSFYLPNLTFSVFANYLLSVMFAMENLQIPNLPQQRFLNFRVEHCTFAFKIRIFRFYYRRYLGFSTLSCVRNHLLDTTLFIYRVSCVMQPTVSLLFAAMQEKIFRTVLQPTMKEFRKYLIFLAKPGSAWVTWMGPIHSYYKKLLLCMSV